MRMLVIKMSSLGDVVHCLPAVTDASRAHPDLAIDWVVEENFAAIPAMHPAVGHVFPIAIRRWRRRPLASADEFSAFRARLRMQPYDLVVDAQGLAKSAGVALMARGERLGFGFRSARERLASLVYDRRVEIGRNLHAVDRQRRLFAAALEYAFDGDVIDYGLSVAPSPGRERQIMLLHGTTWPSKHWPDPYWVTLAGLIQDAGYAVVVPHGNDRELERARAIASSGRGVQILERGGIDALVDQMARSAGVVAVDSGLGHLAAALRVPMVGLFGPTNPALTGFAGGVQHVLASDHLPCIPCLKRQCRFQRRGDIHPPCFVRETPARVWEALRDRMATA